MTGCTGVTALFGSDPTQQGKLKSNLRELHARHAGLADVSFIDALQQLRVLDLPDCGDVGDLSMLDHMPRSERVWAAQTGACNVEWAASCPKLRELIWDEE